MKKARFYSIPAVAGITPLLVCLLLVVTTFQPHSNSYPTATTCTLYWVENYALTNFDIANMSELFVKNDAAKSFSIIYKKNLTNIEYNSLDNITDFA